MGWWLGFPGWIGKVLAMVGNSNCRMVSGSTYHPTGLPGRAFATYHDGMSKGAAPGVMGGLIQGWPAMAPACHRRRASLREFTCGDGRRRSVRIGLPLFAQESQREILPILTPLPRYPGLLPASTSSVALYPRPVLVCRSRPSLPLALAPAGWQRLDHSLSSYG